MRIFLCRYTGWRLIYADARGVVSVGIRKRLAHRMLRNLHGVTR